MTSSASERSCRSTSTSSTCPCRHACAASGPYHVPVTQPGWRTRGARVSVTPYRTGLEAIRTRRRPAVSRPDLPTAWRRSATCSLQVESCLTPTRCRRGRPARVKKASHRAAVRATARIHRTWRARSCRGSLRTPCTLPSSRMPSTFWRCCWPSASTLTAPGRVAPRTSSEYRTSEMRARRLRRRHCVHMDWYL